MNELAQIGATLPAAIRRAADQLAGATSAGEVLAARELADSVYDQAKRAARFVTKKNAHAELLAIVHASQADALALIAMADKELADEYDAAQERGEIAKPSDTLRRGPVIPEGNNGGHIGDLGFTAKQIHEARQIRDAEQIDPGVVRRVLDEKLAAGEEPTKAALREAVIHVATQGLKAKPTPANKNPLYVPPSKAGLAWSHLYGSSRALAEWANPQNLELAVQGLKERPDDQANNIGAVKACIRTLTSFLKESENA
jgi:hypothetical protein